MVSFKTLMSHTTTLKHTENDQASRQRALNLTESFIVQAPAGSGKTTLLVQRFLTLLQHAKSPEDILAITFTNKAANEMRVRIISALKAAALPSPTGGELGWGDQNLSTTLSLAKKALEHSQALNWHLLENPNQLRIQTIDAFCAYLTKQLPHLSDCGPQSEITDLPQFLYEEAVEKTLLQLEENTTWSSDIAHLLLHLDNNFNKLRDLIIALLSKRDQWLAYLHFENDEVRLRNQLEKNLAQVVTDHLVYLNTLVTQDHMWELCDLAEFAAENRRLTDSAKPSNEASPSPRGEEDASFEGNVLTTWRNIAHLLLTQDGEWRKKLDVRMGFPPVKNAATAEDASRFVSYKTRALNMLSILEDQDAFRLALSNLWLLPNPCYTETEWQTLRALFSVLKISVAELRILFQNQSKIDFIENMHTAMMALGLDDSPTNTALTLDDQIKHILVDEFQDISHTQFQLIELLIRGWSPQDGRTLFFVGDPMQSIYRFRNAEVSLFIRTWMVGINTLPLTPLTLTSNFRSSQKIVDWHNTYFKKIFPEINNLSEAAVPFSASIARVAKQGVQPEIFAFCDETDTEQAKQVVALILNERFNHPENKIAILVRARDHLKPIIPLLKDANIPYQAIDIDPLFEKQVILDLVSLTSALIDPANRLAWLAILRAPWCGLTLSDLTLLTENTPDNILYEQLNCTEVIQSLSLAGQERIARTLPILKSALKNRAREALRSWIENTWIALGGPASLTNEADLEDANAYFTLLAKFNNAGESFSIKQLLARLKKLFATPKHHESAVQLMTIHSAKGLEFDTVILPYLERKGALDDHALLLWMTYLANDDDKALLLAPIKKTGFETEKIYSYILNQQKIKFNHEKNRLFYVATTRAKHHLYLLCNITQNAAGVPIIQSDSFLKKLWPLIEKDIPIKTTCPTIDHIAPAKEPQLMRLSEAWQHPLSNTRLPPIALHDQSGGFKLKDPTPQLLGIFLHQMLQAFSIRHTPWWQEQSEHAQKQYIHHHLMQLGLPTSTLPSSVLSAHQMIRNILQDTRANWILKAHTEAQSEWAISINLKNEIKNLVIDRTFIDETGCRWIIDYKTTTFDEENLESALIAAGKKHTKQMQGYKTAIQLFDSRPIRLGLYFPTVPAWHEIIA